MSYKLSGVNAVKVIQSNILSGEGMFFTLCEGVNVFCSGWKNLVYEILV